MVRILPFLNRLLKADEGQDLLEYGLLAVLIAVVAVASVNTLGQTIYTVFWEVIGRGF
jgi:Flp pilus assembly pilin Flp